MQGWIQRMARGDAVPPTTIPPPQTQQPQAFELSTPVNTTAPVDQGVFAACGAPHAPMGGPFLNVPPMAEATSMSGQQHVMLGQGSFQASIPLMPVMPPQATVPQVPAMPQQAAQVPQSWTPDRPPAAYHGATGMSQNPFSPVGQGQANQVQQSFAQTNAAKGNRAVSFEISRKKNDALKRFNANIDDYEMWHDRLVDHICQNCSIWRAVLEFVEGQAQKITMAGTKPLDCMGVNAWELSVMLENCLCSWISDKLYKKRKNFCGAEPGNGFELWQRMRVDYKGGGVKSETRGVGALNTFPKCDSVNSLGPHLDACDDRYDKFGSVRDIQDNTADVNHHRLPR